MAENWQLACIAQRLIQIWQERSPSGVNEVDVRPGEVSNREIPTSVVSQVFKSSNGPGTDFRAVCEKLAPEFLLTKVTLKPGGVMGVRVQE